MRVKYFGRNALQEKANYIAPLDVLPELFAIKGKMEKPVEKRAAMLCCPETSEELSRISPNSEEQRALVGTWSDSLLEVVGSGSPLASRMLSMENPSFEEILLSLLCLILSSTEMYAVSALASLYHMGKIASLLMAPVPLPVCVGRRSVP
ncbi:unnamed protein product [Mesocestoides corti]|uniref:Uncharacterized protein n=1 Tax=Mesocestoides corti TaxID=53468 RepID=A0A0R3UMQ7_MESCO|nr:unnamed protein product [Mesocestoides corti]